MTSVAIEALKDAIDDLENHNTTLAEEIAFYRSKIESLSQTLAVNDQTIKELDDAIIGLERLNA